MKTIKKVLKHEHFFTGIFLAYILIIFIILFSFMSIINEIPEQGNNSQNLTKITGMAVKDSSSNPLFVIRIFSFIGIMLVLLILYSNVKRKYL